MPHRAARALVDHQRDDDELQASRGQMRVAGFARRKTRVAPGLIHQLAAVETGGLLSWGINVGTGLCVENQHGSHFRGREAVEDEAGAESCVLALALLGDELFG